VASEDEKRGKDLAELARLLFLWLQDNELSGIQGLKEIPPGDFELYAGTYHERKRTRNALDNRLVPNLWTGEPAELKRFQELQLGSSHLVLVDNPNHIVQLPDGRRFGQNRIVEAQPGSRLDRAGALVTIEPELDSRDADDATLGRTRNYDICTLLRRVDMVWDDVNEAVQARFRYPALLTYDAPRLAYDMNVTSVIVPANDDPREFRDTLYNTATYKNRRLVAQDDGGDYYRKWRAAKPRDPKERDFRPTLLHDDYLKDCFTEVLMKKGDDVLLVELPAGRALYRLLRDDRRPRRKPSDALTVQPLLVIGQLDPRSAVELAAAKATRTTDTPLIVPIRAVLFHAIDGGNDVPSVRRGGLAYTGGPPTRFTIDYRAYVRWYHGEKVDLGDDENWFQSFVDTFFAGSAYVIDLEHPRPGVVLKGQVLKPDVNREELFLKPLRAAAAEAKGPVQKRLQDLLAWCQASPYRFVFLRSTDFGPEG